MFNCMYWKWDNVIDDKMCQYILDDINWDTEVETGRVSNNPKEDTEIRKTDVVFRDPLLPVSALLQAYIRIANVRAGWNYDIDFCEPAQVGRYTEGGHYRWHVDSGKPDQFNRQRKLSAVMLLNDPTEFEGGKLELKHVDEEILTTKGSIVVFPAFIEHRVSPVISGTRYTATCWVSGPAFK